MTKLAPFLLAATACSGKATPPARELFEVKSMKTIDAVTLTAEVRMSPPAPGTLKVDFYDDLSPVKQHCAGTVKIDTFDADGNAKVAVPLAPRCKRPREPAGFYAHVSFARAAKPELEAAKVMVPGYLGGTNALVVPRELQEQIEKRWKAAQPVPQPNPDPAIDKLIATIGGNLDAVPVTPEPRPCPPALHGKLFLISYDHALAIRNHTAIGAGWALDVDAAQKDVAYELLKYAHGDAYAPETRAMVTALEGRSPVYLRLTDVAIPDGKTPRGKLVGGLYAFDQGALACAGAIDLTIDAKDRASFETQARAKVAARVSEL